MAKRGRRKISDDANEFGEEIDTENIEVEGKEASQDKGETFAESVGLPSNKHAKAMAKAQADALKNAEPHGAFYTTKGLHKIIKLLIKERGVHEIYIGNLKRHKDGLEMLMRKWKKNGEWLEPHQVAEQIVKTRADLANKKSKKK